MTGVKISLRVTDNDKHTYNHALLQYPKIYQYLKLASIARRVSACWAIISDKWMYQNSGLLREATKGQR